MFHHFSSDISGIELPQHFNNPFHYTPHPLCGVAVDELHRFLNGNEEWAADVANGKMLGVLVVRSSSGEVGYVAGFSGLLCGKNRQPGFVPPVFDFLSPDGYFKREEGEISSINKTVACIKNSSEYIAAVEAVATEKSRAENALALRRAEYAANKARRAEKRAAGGLSPEETALLVRESQFEKAELKRLAARLKEDVERAKIVLRLFEDKLSSLSDERKKRSATLQEWLFTQFKVLDACGNEKSLLEIFAEKRGCLPPAGAGECAAPKMLQYAYKNNLQPLAMAEFWVGASPQGEVRRDGCFYGACMSKCHPILTYMLQGVEVEASALERGGENIADIKILYEDNHIIVVDKPSGVLSVPGIVGGDSVQDYLRSLLKSNEVFMVHRLDMATSGLLVAAKSVEVFKMLQAEFALREVEKRYVALLSGVPAFASGEINLPLMPDYDNRPSQKVDFSYGKPARTLYKVVGEPFVGGKQRAVVELLPVTGRTHQLRVHCAHSEGLGMPIMGDALYGGDNAERLMLHAEFIAFSHPVTGKRVEFFSSFDDLSAVVDE